MSAATISGSVSLEMAARVPANVVYRTFAHETVVLDLQTGLYHGLNPVGGRMLEALQQEATVAAALRRLAGEFADAPEAEIERDLVSFCADLLERGLIELGPNGPRDREQASHPPEATASDELRAADVAATGRPL